MSRKNKAARAVGNSGQIKKPASGQGGNKSHIRTAAPAKTPTKKAGLFSRLTGWLCNHGWLVMLIGLWLFLYIFYGDTLRVAQQRSFFVFDSVAMFYWLCQPLGWLYVTGRFLLLSCYWPVCGALLLSLMLTLAARLLDYALGLKGWWKVVAYAAPFAYIAFLFYRGLNLMYLREVSWTMNWPLLALVLCALLAGVKKIVRRKAKADDIKSAPLTKGVLAVWAALWIGCAAVAMTYAENDRLTCSMECKMMDQEWDAMAELAKKASHPSRTVAAYHALALNQNGQMATELLNIPYQYKNAHLSRNNGSFDGGLDYIVVDCNFYAGLTRSAYHEAMEQNVLEGPSIQRIKRMVQCAVADRENALAEKYLAILKKAPFEGDFVERYTAMLQDYNMVLQDPEMASVIELQPVHDSFEQVYREPLFLGYNLELQEAKSIRGLNNSLYACLYTKDMQAFGARIITMIQNGIMLPKMFEEAIVVQNIKNLSVLKQIKLSPYILQEMKDFMSECFNKEDMNLKMEKTEMQKMKAKKFKKYLGTYQYYYYFQNVPDENYVVPEQEKKGGVN